MFQVLLLSFGEACTCKYSLCACVRACVRVCVCVCVCVRAWCVSACVLTSLASSQLSRDSCTLVCIKAFVEGNCYLQLDLADWSCRSNRVIAGSDR